MELTADRMTIARFSPSRTPRIGAHLLPLMAGGHAGVPAAPSGQQQADEAGAQENPGPGMSTRRSHRSARDHRPSNNTIPSTQPGEYRRDSKVCSQKRGESEPGGAGIVAEAAPTAMQLEQSGRGKRSLGLAIASARRPGISKDAETRGQKRKRPGRGRNCAPTTLSGRGDDDDESDANRGRLHPRYAWQDVSQRVAAETDCWEKAGVESSPASTR